MSSGDLTNDTAQECNGFRYGNGGRHEWVPKGYRSRVWRDYAAME